MGGRQPYEILKLHKKYRKIPIKMPFKEKKRRDQKLKEKLPSLTSSFHAGPVVRTGSNELSFNTAQSWHDIYGPRKGHEPFIKSEFYDGLNFAAKVPSIATERNPAQHTEMRKYLGGAFSDELLREQEYLVVEVVDQFIEMLDNSSGEEDGSGKELDLINAVNLMIFDVIGGLAFGESFGGVASGLFWNKNCPPDPGAFYGLLGLMKAGICRQRALLGIHRRKQSREGRARRWL